MEVVVLIEATAELEPIGTPQDQLVVAEAIGVAADPAGAASAAVVDLMEVELAEVGKMITEILKVPYQSKMQIQSIGLRKQVLRTPLGLEFQPSELASEGNQWHIVTIHKTHVIACNLVKFLASGEAKIRQVATHPNFQGIGLGKTLNKKTEELLAANGIKKVVLHARINAVPFYEKLNYTIVGQPFEEVGIKHYKMEKHL